MKSMTVALGGVQSVDYLCERKNCGLILRKKQVSEIGESSSDG